MIKILFVCHGNICRSPMAEYAMKDIVKNYNRENDFYIESCAVSYEEEGNPVYPPVKRLLNEYGIDCSSKRARILVTNDYDKFDYIIAMDKSNLYGIKRIIGDDIKHKVYLLMSFVGEDRDVLDPWYTRDFNEAYKDIKKGCNSLYDYLKNF